MAGFNSSISGTQSGAKLSGSDGITSQRQAGLTRKPGGGAEAEAIPDNIGNVASAFEDANIEKKGRDKNLDKKSPFTQFMMSLTGEKASYWKEEPAAEIA